jgi:hypothetical protein
MEIAIGNIPLMHAASTSLGQNSGQNPNSLPLRRVIGRAQISSAFLTSG